MEALLKQLPNATTANAFQMHNRNARLSCPDHTKIHPVPAVKLLGIMLRNRCWPTTFHTVTGGDADCGAGEISTSDESNKAGDRDKQSS